MSTVELRFAALPGHVRTARMVAMTVSRRAGVPGEAIDEIKLAVGEACARAVRVNRRLAPDSLVHVRLVDSPDAFVVAVSDRGTPEGEQLDQTSLLGLGGGGAQGDRGQADAGDDRDSGDPTEAGGGAVSGGDRLGGDRLGGGDKGERDAADAGLTAGIGLALIEGLVDEMEITSGENGAGTVVTMRWRTEPKPEDTAGPAAL
jgi:anti-sigma regulatory factor (Ser/Thr protein kinase)